MNNNKIRIIAEIGHNFNGSMKIAKDMILEAKECGADLVKFQLYDVNTIKKPYQSRYFELWAAELSKENLLELKETAKEIGIELFASVFSADRVDWLENIGVKRYKIASRSIYDSKLIKRIELTGKPIIASLGKWKEQGLPRIKNAEYLYCVSDYPARIDRDKFPKKFNSNGYTGFSDHTIGTGWAKEALRRGATILEKHFTLSKQLPGYNQEGSCEPYELKDIVKFARQIEQDIS